MSDLKHKSIGELQNESARCKERASHLSGELKGIEGQISTLQHEILALEMRKSEMQLRAHKMREQINNSKVRGYWAEEWLDRKRKAEGWGMKITALEHIKTELLYGNRTAAPLDIRGVSVSCSTKPAKSEYATIRERYRTDLTIAVFADRSSHEGVEVETKRMIADMLYCDVLQEMRDIYRLMYKDGIEHTKSGRRMRAVIGYLQGETDG